MDELFQHPRIILEVLVAYWLFSAAVTSMPDPPANSFWYKWIYGTLHAFSGNLTKFAESKIRSLETTHREPDGAETVTKTTITETKPKEEPPKP